MSRQPDYLNVDATFREALHNMRDQHVQRLIVLDNAQDKRFAGVLSISDVADKCADGNAELGKLICQATRHYH